MVAYTSITRKPKKLYFLILEMARVHRNPPRPYNRQSCCQCTAPVVEYSRKNPRIRKMNQAVTRGSLARVQKLVEEWRAMPNATKDLPPGPPGYMIEALEPVLHHAVRKSNRKIVSCLMEEGIQMSEAALWDALDRQASNDVFKAFLNHGWDINADLRGTPTPLTIVAHLLYRYPMLDSLIGILSYRYVLENERLLHWFLDRGANPNTSCNFLKTPFEHAVRTCPLSTVQLLNERGALPGNTAPVAEKSEVPGRLEVIRCYYSVGRELKSMTGMVRQLWIRLET